MMDNALRKAANTIWENARPETIDGEPCYAVSRKDLEALFDSLASEPEWTSTNIAPDHYGDVEVLVMSRGHCDRGENWWVLPATDSEALFWREGEGVNDGSLE